jgi:hypothetical protein
VAVTLVAGVLVLAACGSASRVQTVPAPRLPRSVSSSLAARSDALASALLRRDSCAAKTQVHELEHATRLAIRDGHVPAVYRQKLLTAVTRLAARMPRCVPPPPAPPPPPPPPPEKKPPKHHHDGKHGDNGDGGD